MTQEKNHSNSDNQLMVKVSQGDSQAFAKLYKKYFPIVQRYLTSRNGYHGSIEHLIQEVFVRLWEHRGRFRGESAFSSYLLGIAKFVLMEDNRQIQKDNRFLGTIKELNLNQNSLLPYNLSQPVSDLHAKELKETIERAKSRLPALHRQAFELVYIMGLSVVEAAKISKCSCQTLQARLYEARKNLQKTLQRLPIIKERNQSIA